MILAEIPFQRIGEENTKYFTVFFFVKNQPSEVTEPLYIWRCHGEWLILAEIPFQRIDEENTRKTSVL